MRHTDSITDTYINVWCIVTRKKLVREVLEENTSGRGDDTLRVSWKH
jgi:hypothetical protein